MQELLDLSAARGGAHLHEVMSSERRRTAIETCERLQGMRRLSLATAKADGRPLVGPVDGTFSRGCR